MKKVESMTNSQKLDLILTEISDMKIEISDMKTEMSDMKTEISDMKTEMSDMKTQVNSMAEDIKNINLSLENEIRVNIRRIAEGHLDLSRNLHEAIKPSKEIEMLSIKVNTLESEVRDIKRKIS